MARNNFIINLRNKLEINNTVMLWVVWAKSIAFTEDIAVYEYLEELLLLCMEEQ